MPEHQCLPLDQTAADVLATFGELSDLPAHAASTRSAAISSEKSATGQSIDADSRSMTTTLLTASRSRYLGCRRRNDTGHGLPAASPDGAWS